MSFGGILYTIFIGPLQLIFEIIFSLAYRIIGHPGLAIVALSLIMNILILPLYKRSDAMQEEARDTEEKLRKGVEHIKKTFSGDERMMILQTYYRQNNYKPTNALQGSVSLLLEIPFFMAAYQFLSHVNVLQGASLGPIMDLGTPDALVTVGGVSFNLLPIVMTVINVVSSAIYLKGFPLKTKIQLYGMALFFLVFLYTSPSGLVFYWILNNIFSLVKNICYKLSNNQKWFRDGWSKIQEKSSSYFEGIKGERDSKIFFLGSVVISVLVGMLIPSTIIEASTLEFVNYNFYNPLWYIVNAVCLSVGTFLIWLRVFYWLAKPVGKLLFERLIWVLCGIMIVNYMFFGTKLGVISTNLQYENGFYFENKEKLINIVVLIVVAVIFYIIVCKWKNLTGTVLLTVAIVLGGMSVYNIWNIREDVEDVKERMGGLNDEMPQFTLSKEGKNVVVLMLDRAMGEYIPYLFNEKPELKEQFSGFTYYSNVLSFGAGTNFGTPGLFGGYEYTPVEMNRRDTETLAEKHNEALKVMPVLFDENDYKVTVCDPPYANYSWFPDLRIYDEYPEISKYITEGRFGNYENQEYRIQKNRRNFFCFSVMKTMPLLVQGTIYDGGNYHRVASEEATNLYLGQKIVNNTVAEGIRDPFMQAYNVLVNLPKMTLIEGSKEDTFLMMCNNAPHEPVLVQEPEYAPAQYVDNTEFEAANADRYIYNGIKLKTDDFLQVSHYQTNMAVMLQLGKWFDYMRKNDVYDNTRIILVSDHGRNLYQIEELTLEEGENRDTIEFYYPLLMVKDFGSTQFVISEEFMTNADVPTLATEGVIENPINPFTGKRISDEEKTAHDQYVIKSLDFDITENCGNTYFPAKWYAVSRDIRDTDNWRLIDEKVVIPSELVEK